MSIGPITLRLRADVVEHVWATLGEAIAHRAHDAARRRLASEHLS